MMQDDDEARRTAVREKAIELAAAQGRVWTELGRDERRSFKREARLALGMRRDVRRTGSPARSAK
jgi:hypothetical protein